MSEATLRDPHVRVTRNSWYLYLDRGPIHGPDGCVRAVIEEICDETWSGDGGPTRQRRRVYLDAENVRDSPRAPLEHAAHDLLDWRIENEMTDEEFRQLTAEGTIVPLRTT